MVARHEIFVNRALTLASTSKHHKYLHGAIVTRNNKILSMAVNRVWNPARIDHEHATIHAEVAALRGVSLIKRATIYVARINHLGYPRLSKPCDDCWETLVDCNIDEVVYSTEDGFIIEKIG